MTVESLMKTLVKFPPNEEVMILIWAGTKEGYEDRATDISRIYEQDYIPHAKNVDEIKPPHKVVIIE